MLSLGAPRQRKSRKDIGVKRTRHSNSSSSDFDHDSSSHQVNDDENRGDEGTSRVSTPSPTTYYKSSSQNIPQQWGGLKSIGKAFKKLWKKKKK
ncbi:hypothetical protein Tco_0115038 [Tanacetum coccineum]